MVGSPCIRWKQTYIIRPPEANNEADNRGGASSARLQYVVFSAGPISKAVIGILSPSFPSCIWLGTRTAVLKGNGK